MKAYPNNPSIPLSGRSSLAKGFLDSAERATEAQKMLVIVFHNSAALTLTAGTASSNEIYYLAEFCENLFLEKLS
jgi:hypothetical protein